MKRIAICITAALLAGSVGIAYALPMPNLVSNGDFSATSPTQTTPTQFGGRPGQGCSMPGRTWGGQFITGWTGGGYSIWYPSATASHQFACGQFGLGSSSHATPPGAGQSLPPGNGDDPFAGTVTAPPNPSGTFVGLDGQSRLNGWIQQSFNSLIAGGRYTVNFFWAGTQEMSTFYSGLVGPTSQHLVVSLGTSSQSTPIITVGTRQFSGWMPQSFTFTANSSSEILKFMAFGTPSVPPFSLLAGVTMTQTVPEPPELAMFGLGLLGLGVMTVVARRRALRRKGEGDIA